MQLEESNGYLEVVVDDPSSTMRGPLPDKLLSIIEEKNASK